MHFHQEAALTQAVKWDMNLKANHTRIIKEKRKGKE